MENQSGRDEASSGSPSIERLGGAMGLGLGGGGRKRKSRNPTRINLANMMDMEESKNKTNLDNQGILLIPGSAWINNFKYFIKATTYFYF